MKTPMVTRSFITTHATALALQVETVEPQIVCIDLPGHYDDETKILKDMKKLLETDELKLCKVLSVTEGAQLRGMTVQKFLELSEVIEKPAKAETESVDNQ